MQATDSNSPRAMSDFAATRWSLVAAAADRAQASLAELCVRYWFPVYAYVRRSGHPPETAQQVTLAFFHHLVSKRLARIEQSATGRFREYLLTEIDHFLATTWDGVPVSRPAEGLAAPLPLALLESRHQNESLGTGSATAAFQRGFALQVIARALERLRREAAQAGREAMFEGLQPWLANEPPAGEYEALARRLDARPLSLVIALRRLRRLTEKRAKSRKGSTTDPASQNARPSRSRTVDSAAMTTAGMVK
jgi:RNA polymerase sigma-70 factor (ECF subfamily)